MLQRAAAGFRAALDRLCREHGLTAAQYEVLCVLREEGAPLPSMKVLDRLAAPLPDITRLIDRLERGGLVKRERSTQDRRIVRLAITARGAGVAADLDGPVKNLLTDLFRRLDRHEVGALGRLLVRAHVSTKRRRRTA